jgi:acid phosphatase family membrane protein YuiD
MSYLFLLLPIVSILIVQTAKFFVKSNHRKLNLQGLMSYSGMPSGHSALVISLLTIIGLIEGFNSSDFAISMVIAIVVIRDALGLRIYLGQHGKILNLLVKDLKDDKYLDDEYPHLLEKIGHTPAQVLVGALIGFLVSFLGFYFWA